MRKLILLSFLIFSTCLYSQTNLNAVVFYNSGDENENNLQDIEKYTELKKIISKNLNYQQISPLVVSEANIYSDEYRYPVKLSIMEPEYYKSFSGFIESIEGSFPENGKEALISESVSRKLSLKIGDIIAVSFSTKLQSLWALNLIITGIIPFESDFVYINYEENKQSIHNYDIVDAVVITVAETINEDIINKIIHEYQELSDIQLGYKIQTF